MERCWEPHVSAGRCCLQGCFKGNVVGWEPQEPSCVAEHEERVAKCGLGLAPALLTAVQSDETMWVIAGSAAVALLLV